MTRTRVILVSAAVIAGGAALLWSILAYTPLRRLLPESLSGDLRQQYIETALRLDSLEQQARLNNAFLGNLTAIMADEVSEDSVMVRAAETLAYSDSLLAASEAEKNFVRSYEEEARFNLSVLSPIAAEGMVFNAPASAPVTVEALPEGRPGVYLVGADALAAVYRGTVVGVSTASDGTSTVTVQHPNDFISVYDGLGDVFVEKGRQVAAAQRIGHAAKGSVPAFELWHKGNALDPLKYMNFE